MTFGEFLSQVLNWLYELWPFRIVLAWEQGVRLRGGNPTKLLTSTNGWWGSGLHGFYPLYGEIIVEDCEARVIETDWQSLITLDGFHVSFSLAARYKIRDLVKLYTEIDEQTETIRNQLSASAGVVIRTLKNWEVDALLAKRIKKEAQPRLRGWGVTLLDVALYNRVETNTLRLIQE